MIELLAGVVYGATACGSVALLVEAWRLRGELKKVRRELDESSKRLKWADELNEAQARHASDHSEILERIGNLYSYAVDALHGQMAQGRKLDAIAAELRATIDHDCEEQVMHRTTVLKASEPIVKAIYCPRCSSLSTNEKPEPIRVGGGGCIGDVIATWGGPLRLGIPLVDRSHEHDPEDLRTVVHLRYETCGKHGCPQEGRHVIQGSMTYYACSDHVGEISALAESEG